MTLPGRTILAEESACGRRHRGITRAGDAIAAATWGIRFEHARISAG